MSKDLPRRRFLAGTALLGTTSFAGCFSESATGATTPRESTSRSVGSTGSARASGSPPDFELEDLESFVDEQLDARLEDHDVVGASVAVVHDDAVELARGYGETDVDDGEPVDDETAFRIGSVSKPLVWTAVMGLIEDGRIDSHEDVRTYLESVSIADAYDEPITIAHLATHTAGFEERFQGTWVDEPDERRPLPDVLDAEQPERVRPPGTIASYSNYGTALAAQVVADVTGTPFDEYVAESVFGPLEMTETTFDYPRPDDHNAAVSSGYTAAAGTVQSTPDLFLEIGPAGSVTATASDMTRFLRAHLGDGLVDGERILEAETVAEMHDQWFTHHDALPGIAFGLLEDERRGVRVLEHNGAIPGSFYSYLLLVPEYDLGLFLAYNTNTGAVANGEFVDAFLEEYVPDESTPTASEPDGQPDRADALEGTYRGVRVAESTHARLSSTLQAGTIEVTVDEDGSLVTTSGGGSDRWVEREPLVFDARDGEETLAFGEIDGEITHLFSGFQAYERTSWQESMSLHGAVAGVSSLGMLSGIVGWPLAWAGRQVLGDDGETDSDRSGAQRADHPSTNASDAGQSSGGLPEVERPPETERTETLQSNGSDRAAATAGSRDRSWYPSLSPQARPRWVVGGAITCLFGFVAGTIALLLFNPYTLLSDPPRAFALVSLFLVFGAVGTIAALGYTVVAWRRGYWSRLSRIHYTVVVASTAGLYWLLYYWNFLGSPF